MAGPRPVLLTARSSDGLCAASGSDKILEGGLLELSGEIPAAGELTAADLLVRSLQSQALWTRSR